MLGGQGACATKTCLEATLGLLEVALASQPPQKASQMRAEVATGNWK